MPLPTPSESESKQEFISRCIETLTRENSDTFPSRRQRIAVCYSRWGGEDEKEWRRKHKKEGPRS